MTIEEVKFCINGDGLIECRDVCQRMEAVQFLVDIGYELHPAAKKWLDENPNNTDFMYPGLDIGNHKVTCYRGNHGKQTILFRDIEVLIAQNDTPIDERSSEEFLDAFAELMN